MNAATIARKLQIVQRTLLVGLVLAFAAPAAVACPFCEAVSATWRQEIEAVDAVVIAEAPRSPERDEATGEVEFKIVQRLKGGDFTRQPTVTAVYFGDLRPLGRYLLSGVDAGGLQWSCMPLSEESEAFLLQILEFGDDELERIRFVQQYLEHSDSMLRREAYNEFAITPYPVIQQLRDDMDREQLVRWIQDPELPPDRRRLYLTMLGVCGSEAEVPMLEAMLTDPQRESRSGLDALIACYLLLGGEEKLELINERFLGNSEASYTDTYAAIMALRFHGTEADKIPRSALVESLHLVLDRKELADLVIPDLARWNDWSQIDRLVGLFVEADEDNRFIRVPVVNYLRACPKPEAAEALEKLKEIDPDSVRRAGALIPVPVPKKSSQPETSLHIPSRGEQLAMAASRWSVDFPAWANAGRGITTERPNRVRLSSVATMAVATLVISFYLVLSGGSRCRRQPTAA